MVPITVEVDVHELRSAVPTELERLGVRVATRPLPAGDYDVGGGTLVERKTTVDLVLSLQTGRLWRQLGIIRRRSSFPVLIVEGRPPHVRLGEKAGRGLMLAVVDQGIVVLASSGAAETAAWIESLARHRQTSRPRDRPPFSYRQRMTPERPGERLLCGIEGISIHHARSLLSAFGSVTGVMDASPEQWLAVRGIGPVRAAAMSKSFGPSRHD